MVKKLSIAVMAIFMMASLAACGNSNSGDKAAETVAQTQAATENTEAEMSEITEAAETEVAETEAAETETAETEAVETDATEAAQTEAATGEATAEAGGSDSIVVYFSWSGNTRTIAEEIQNQTGADIFELTSVTPYSTDYNTVLDEAQAEQSENARPEISGTIESFEQYDVVYLGYPNWWGDMPMIIYSLLDDYDFAGKTIVPFVSSGGSGFSNSLTTIAEMEPDATLTEGLSLSSSASAEPADAVTEWLASLNME